MPENERNLIFFIDGGFSQKALIVLLRAPQKNNCVWQFKTDEVLVGKSEIGNRK